jgi:hypothetical protein
MHVDEYRFFITQISKLEARVEVLDRILEEERQTVSELIDKIGTYHDAQIEEREAGDQYVKELEHEIKVNKWSRYLPGIIAGVRPSDGWSRVEGVIGLGWQFPVTGLFNLK